MRTKVFIDTHILVYAADRWDAEKQAKAKACLSDPAVDMVISTQVLQEYYVTLTKKLDVPPSQAKRLLRSLERIETVLLDPPLILDAVDCHAMEEISFWDGLIVCAAARARCSELWSEDLNPSQSIRGVCIVNPLNA